VDIWSEARRLRTDRGLSQSAVAKLMGTSQSWVARMESGRVDPGLSSVRRYLAVIGARLVLESQPGQTMFQPPSLAALASAARRHIGDDETLLRMSLQFLDDFEEATPSTRRGLLVKTPPGTGDPRWDAFFGALAEHLSYHHDLPIPGWTARDDRFLRRWWFLSDLPSVRAAALAESPAAFRRRGVFITVDFFERA
jgi:transcriptional regulator with XRE-family HTH domain